MRMGLDQGLTVGLLTGLELGQELGREGLDLLAASHHSTLPGQHTCPARITPQWAAVYRVPVLVARGSVGQAE